MNKEIATINTKVNKALTLSQEMTITESTLPNGIDFLQKIKLTGKIVKEQKEKITKPLNLALKEARDLFRPIENNYLLAEKNVKQKILDYNLVIEAKKKEQMEKLAKRVEKGTMKMETAVKKIEAIPETVKEGKSGKVSTRTVKKVIITSEAKLPRKYLIPNQSLIRQDAFKGIEIDGVKVVEEQIIASY